MPVACIPHLDLSKMKTDVGVPPRAFLDNGKNGANAIGRTTQIIVQRKQALTVPQHPCTNALCCPNGCNSGIRGSL